MTSLKNNFIKELKSLNGTPEEILDNQELMALLLPLLRADFEIADTYCSDNDVQVNCPLTVLGGSTDSDIKRTDLESWGQVFSQLKSVNIFEGGHFFIESNPAPVLKLVNDIIRDQFDTRLDIRNAVQLELA